MDNKRDAKTTKDHKWNPAVFAISLIEIIGQYAARQNRHEKQDEHDRIIRYWTRAGVISSVLAVIVAGVAACFLYNQLQAAQAANNAADQAEIITTRPYVIYTGIKECSAIIGPDKKHIIGINFCPTWQNMGRTPTRHLRLFDWRGEIPPNQASAYRIPSGAPQPVVYIGPFLSYNGAPIGLTFDQLQGIQMGKLKYSVWGAAAYNDGFRHTLARITRFCEQIVGVGGDINKGFALSTAACGYGNCIDDECD